VVLQHIVKNTINGKKTFEIDSIAINEDDDLHKVLSAVAPVSKKSIDPYHIHEISHLELMELRLIDKGPTKNVWN
jgi:hypothetical protein